MAYTGCRVRDGRGRSHCVFMLAVIARLRHLDGQRDRAALADLIMSWLDQHNAAAPADLPASAVSADSPRSRAERYVDELLRGFAKAAFLIG